MAKKKAPKKSARSSRTKDAAPPRKRRPKPKKMTQAMRKENAAKVVAKLLAPPAVGTKHKKARIGLTKKNGTTTVPPFVFLVDQENTFTVYGDSIGSGNPHSAAHPKKVKLKSSGHNWDNVDSDTDLTDVGNDSLQIKATPHAKTKSFGPFFGTDDDLTVTITIDDGTPGCDTTECYFPDVDFDA